MGYTLVAAVLCLAILRLSEGVAPVITGGSQTKEFAENTLAAGTAFTLTSDQGATYALTGTDSSSFDVTPKSGSTAIITATVTINNAPDYDTKTSYTVIVTATNAASEATPATVTLNVIKKPSFPTTTLAVTPCDGAAVGAVVATASQLTATGHTGRTFVYAIASGNTGTYLTIDTGTGKISVAKILSKATTPTITVVVTAAYTTTPVQTATATVVATIGTTCGSAAITGSLAALLCMIFSIIQKLA